MRTSGFLLFLILFQPGNKSYSQCSVVISNINKICIGDTVTLTANAFGGTPPYTYLWNDLSYLQTITVSPTVTTSYSVTVTDANACTASDTVIVEVFPPLSIFLYTPDDTLCPLECTDIVVSVKGGMGGPYTLKLNDGTVVSSPFHVCPGVTTTYIVTATDSCTTPPVSSSITIFVLPYPPVNIVADKLNGCVPLTVNFAETSTDEGMAYLWDFGDHKSSVQKTPKHTFKEPGTYDISCTVTSIIGCKSILTIKQMITVFPSPEASFTVDPEETTMLEPTIGFQNTSNVKYYSLWIFGDGDSSTITHPEHTYKAPGIYLVTLYIESEHGCYDTTQGFITIHDHIMPVLPQAFSPNGDGANDILYVRGEEYKSFEFRIYNKWGELLFETNLPDSGWDGKYNDTPQPCGVYVYTLNVSFYNGDTKKITGEVTLLK